MSNAPSPTERENPHGPSSSDVQTPNIRLPLHRTTSQTSWSAEAPHHNQGTSYFPSSPTPRRAPARSISVARSLSVNTEQEEDEEDTGTSGGRGKAVQGRNSEGQEEADEVEAEVESIEERHYTEEDPLTLKDRQSLMNVDHPFGLPIWKPALYKKSRTINRAAETALHATPTAYGELHLNLGNILWAIVFGWWLAIACLAVSVVLFLVPWGGRRYAPLIFGLGWYIFWPFGKYVEGFSEEDAYDTPNDVSIHVSDTESNHTIRPEDQDDEITPRFGTLSPVSRTSRTTLPSPLTPNAGRRSQRTERSSLFRGAPKKSYGTVPKRDRINRKYTSGDWLGRAAFWLFLVSIIAPLLLVVCLICWFFVVTIPMAKLNWVLIKHLFERPDTIRFCAAPPATAVPSPDPSTSTGHTTGSSQSREPAFVYKSTRLSAGQVAPSGIPTSKVLLCTYRAIGFQYYKYTVGGVNIFFVNLMAVVFFAIIDGFFLLEMKENLEREGKHIPAVLDFLANRPLIFISSLASVIPLSYFIGMAVASISAQSSIGMGAVINATFGSIIEIILYAIALTQGKGQLVEGSIVGSLLAGVLLMPGASMCSGALRKKEQKFNAKSAGVTSTMLIMAIIGTLTPTLFYQTYGNFELICDGCPSVDEFSVLGKKQPWSCSHCYYEHPDPVHDDFYQSTVKSLMYFCAAILLFSYLVGLWFSLRTHASQIWQNPQQLMHPLELPPPPPGPGGRVSLYHRLTQAGLSLPTHRLNRKASEITNAGEGIHETHNTREQQQSLGNTSQPASPTFARQTSQAGQPPSIYTPLYESVDQAVKNSGVQNLQLPGQLTSDDFTRAVAVATVSALRHQQAYQSPARLRVQSEVQEEHGGHGGHEAPSWSRTTSASVLLACTALYAAIAEILVDVVDVVLEGSGINEKFLGLTLFALVPNTTEFMNAMSFAMYGNIALSMEIGSAYALQVCLLQIPAMVAFSAWHDPEKMGTAVDTFTLIFPRWDVIAIVLSIFLLTYTYIEAKSNYHRGTILILSYLVLIAGFYFAPRRPEVMEVFKFNNYQPGSILESLQFSLSSLWV